MTKRYPGRMTYTQWLRTPFCEKHRPPSPFPRDGMTKGASVTRKYPGRMTYMQWLHTPFRKKHRLLGVMLNNLFRYWRDCKDARCRRARSCQDHECYWRRLAQLPWDEQSRLRTRAAPWEKLLWLGSDQGSEGRMRY